MSVTARTGRACPVEADLTGSVTTILASQVQRWSNECQCFLEWQRQEVLLVEATHEIRSHHKAVLRRLLALGRMLNAVTSDPEFMDRRAAELVNARLAQLRESWELAHPQMTAVEAEAFLTDQFQN